MNVCGSVTQVVAWLLGHLATPSSPIFSLSLQSIACLIIKRFSFHFHAHLMASVIDF